MRRRGEADQQQHDDLAGPSSSSSSSSRHYLASSQRSTAQYGPNNAYAQPGQSSTSGRIPYGHQQQYQPLTGPYAYMNAAPANSSPSLTRTPSASNAARATSPSSSPFEASIPLELPTADAAAAHSQPSTSKPQTAATKVSCLECRSSKVKCLPQNPHEPVGLGQPGVRCARCERLDKACVFEKHKRGRKPDSWKYGRLEKQLESILSELRPDRDGSVKLPAREDNTRDSPGSEEPAQKRLRTETAEILSNWRAASAASGSTKSERVAALSRALEEGRSSRSTGGVAAPTAGDDEDDETNDDDDNAGTSRRESSTVRRVIKREDPLPETGLPSLSNPLKLLAQASAGDEGFGADPGVDRIGADLSTSRPTTRNGTGSKQTSPRAPSRRAFALPAGRLAQDRLGIYEEKLENGPDLDPICKGLITIENAQYLWTIFLDKLSHPLMLLDSKVYTFEYTRPRSSMLLSVGLALTARFIPATPEFPTDVIADEIDKHVLQKIIPTLIVDGKRSMHAAKALMLLAAYNGHSIPLSEDRSFTYVSWAFTMSVELDLNRRLFSMSADQNDETLQRALRERERTFLEAWAYSFSIALHHGRRCNLSIHDPVVAAASQWHRSPYAIPEDAGLVSNIQLRQLIARNLDFFFQHVAPAMPKTSADGPPDQACRLLLEFHRKSITEDLDAWHATWVVPVVSEARPFRLHSTAYYHAYATLILHSLPMKHGTENEPCLKSFSDQAHQAALSVVAFFLRLPQEQIIWGHNSIHVTVGFAVVYALREEVEVDPSVSIVEMVEQVIERMETAGGVTPHRRSFASGVARFLKKVLRVHCMRKSGGADGYTSRRASVAPSSSAAAVEENLGTHATATGTASSASSTSPPASSSIMAPMPLQGPDTATPGSYNFGVSANLFDSVPGMPTQAPSGQHATPGGSLFSAPGPVHANGTAYTAGATNGNVLPSQNNHLADLFVDLPPHTMPDHIADQSPAAMMDTLMMNHPIGVQFNSLLGQNGEWGNDWSFFLPGADEHNVPHHQQ